MRINKIQDASDYSEFIHTAGNFAVDVYNDAPKDVRKVIADVFWSLMMRANVPNEEARELINHLEDSMGYLFENAEKMDIQAERENTRRAREELEKTKVEAEEKITLANAKVTAIQAELSEMKKKLDELQKQNAILRAGSTHGSSEEN